MLRVRVTFPWSLLAACLGCGTAIDVVAERHGEMGDGGESASAATGGSSGATLPPLQVLELTGDLEVHDPMIAKLGEVFTVLSSGTGIVTHTSIDLVDFVLAEPVFAENPAWITELLPDVTALWSPDLSSFGDRAHLYYSASVFGTGQSCIGHATRPALDFDQPFEDAGQVICSDIDGADDDWDAIDPNVIRTEQGVALVFGSFGAGLQLIRLDEEGRRADDSLTQLAVGPEPDRAIQAPFLHFRAPYYYLFASYGFCCRGIDSTHEIRVGRAEAIEGPYRDRDGVPMLEGGGTVVLSGDDRYRATGGNAILVDGERLYNVYHAYDANLAGRATLRIAELAFDALGWPVSGGP